MQNSLTQERQVPEKKHRDSNLELFRILTMLLIIAHHYVVNSGLTNPEGPVFENLLSFDSLFLLILGAWGKIGINCFVLITGYFMIKSEISIRKFLKLFLEFMFYKIIIGLIFIISGYQSFELKKFIKIIIPILSVDQNFTGCYILFFLFIPFLNILIKNLDEKKHKYLLVMCFITYIFFGTFHRVSMNYVSWFMVLYVISSYLRMYPKKWMENNVFCGIMFILTILMSSLSVLVSTLLNVKLGKPSPFYFVVDSNAFLAVITGLFSFLFFKNLKIKHNRFINAVASTTFGILLIHANSDTMRQWLWQDKLDNVGHYGNSIYAIVSVICVFIVCSIIDYIRIRLIEIPFFKIWDKHEKQICSIILKEKEIKA